MQRQSQTFSVRLLKVDDDLDSLVHQGINLLLGEVPLLLMSMEQLLLYRVLFVFHQ